MNYLYSQMTTNNTTVRKLQMKVTSFLMAVVGLFAAHAANVPSSAYYLGAPDAEHAHATRRHEGIPSMARDPSTGRLWAVWYGGVTPCEDSNNYLMIATSENDGDTWKEVLVYDPDGSGPVRAFDPEMWVSPDGKLQITWTERTVPVAETPTNGKWNYAHLSGADDCALAS
ncbi:MAG: exo-alpha-sialidase, partial [Kiritimatiellae bacterium]|nr:exo-alpha-sialidase [Kiritimatiellia bacterium]